MRDLYPGYDVLSKRNTPSWNELTRRVIDARTSVEPSVHRFLSDADWATLCAVCDRIVPQHADRVSRIPIAALIDRALVQSGFRDGYRDARLPAAEEAWKRGLAALAKEAINAHAMQFWELSTAQQDALLHSMQTGQLRDAVWGDMPSDVFFKSRLLTDIVRTYYSHPIAWNEIGWGGPASPRGYVRLVADRRDPWEAAEAKPGREAEARRENLRVAR
jgi:gluconate 2-dehydrogenase subunit 3-like protein